MSYSRLVDALTLVFTTIPQRPAHDQRDDPNIAWAPPAGVAYVPGGFALTGAQLNATTNPPGIQLTYNPPLGATLNAGTHALKVWATDAVNYDDTPVAVMLVVRAAKAIITWKPAPVDYVAGGYVLGGAFDATTVPSGLELKYSKPADARLDAGSHDATVSLADTETNYVGDPVAATLIVKPAKATITWKPAPVDYVAGGYILGGAFDATTVPSGLDLKYSKPADTKLDAGPHDATVSLADTETNYVADPVAATLIVKPAKATITWKPAPVDYVAGGYILGGAFDATTVPSGLNLNYSRPADTKLDAGPHDITVSLAYTETNYVADLVAATLVVNKAKATIAWLQPDPVESVEGGFKLTKTQLSATTNPPNLALIYEPKEGDPVNLGDHNVLNVALAGTVTNYEAEDSWVTLKVNPPAVVKIDKKPREPSPTETKTKEKPKTFKAMKAEKKNAKASKKEKVEEPEAKTITVNGWDTEWIIGGPNKTPHIHHYGPDMHIKLPYRGKIKRLNLIQGDKRHVQIAEALVAAADYDKNNRTNLVEIINTALDKHAPV